RARRARGGIDLVAGARGGRLRARVLAVCTHSKIPSRRLEGSVQEPCRGSNEAKKRDAPHAGRHVRAACRQSSVVISPLVISSLRIFSTSVVRLRPSSRAACATVPPERS